jgi:hypothetical protein
MTLVSILRTRISSTIYLILGGSLGRYFFAEPTSPPFPWDDMINGPARLTA